MTVQTIKLGRERFVLLREKDYLALKESKATPTRKVRRRATTDRADLAEAKRRLTDPTDKPVRWEKAKKELGLA